MVSPLARRLRHDPTDAERKLWQHLRHKELEGFRFRRQHPIGSYVVDFFCPSACLIVEVDGGQHDPNLQAERERTTWLEGRGYRVLRFWNNDVLGNIEGVLEVVRRALAEGPPPTQPSPSRGEGKKRT